MTIRHSPIGRAALAFSLCGLLGLSGSARAEVDAPELLDSPRPAQLPDLEGPPPPAPPPDAGPPLLPDGGVAPLPPPSQEQVLRVVADHAGEFAACVESEHTRRPNWLATKMSVGFTIASAGKVTAARLGDPKLNGTPLGKCLRAALLGMSFPAFDGEPQPFELPLMLSSRPGARPR